LVTGKTWLYQVFINLSNNKFEGLNSMEIILTGKLSLSFP